MGKYKLIALDLDGTVLDKYQKISVENRKAILDATRAGVTVMFATGRGIYQTIPYMDDIGIQSPIVTVNGSEVWKKPYELLERRCLEQEVIRKLWQLAVAQSTRYWAYTLEGEMNRGRWPSDVDSTLWLKFGFTCGDPEVLRRIQEELESWDILEISSSDPNNIELNPKGVSKATGILRVCELLHIDMSEVVTVGDSLNDLAMIRAAGLGVAMGNAHEEVKRAAKLVTLSNEENGVSEVINKYVLA